MHDKPLLGKKILFFCPAFFGYELKIRDKMIDLGADVSYYNERPIEKNYQKALLKINPNILSRQTEDYFFNILNEVKNIAFDYVFFLKCEMPTEHILEAYRLAFPKSIFTLYMWDSLSNVVDIRKKLPYFDKVYSFDLADSKSHKDIFFRPLFFADDFKRTFDSKVTYRYDVSFLGTIHSDRYKIIKQVQAFLEANRKSYYFFNFLQSRFMYSFYCLTKAEFRGTKASDFDFIKLSSSDIAEIVDESKAVLDIQHPKQTGLTMRTIEMIGMNKKIITTNAAIKEYDFYNPTNICVIGRDDITIDPEFFETTYEPLSTEIYDKYSLRQWVLDVLK